MKLPQRLIAVACGFLAASAFPVPASAAEVLDTKSLRQALDKLKEQQKQLTEAQRGRFFKDLQNAASSDAAAVEFYEQAVRATQFSGQSKEGGAFRDWRKANEARLKSDGFQKGLRFHLTYLALSVEYASGRDLKELVGPLMNYTRDLGPKLPDLAEGREWLGTGISDSIFTRWYGAKSWLAGSKNWEAAPGNIDGIYDKAIFPELRLLHDRQIIALWDERIKREAAAASAAKLAFTIDTFNVERRPELQWDRAQDELIVGDKNQAILDMMAIVKANPGHPQAATWIDRLDELVNGDPLAPPAAESSPSP